jgi:hypothetical protein
MTTTTAMIIATSLAAAAPVTAAPMSRQQFVMNWCASHPGDRDCRDFGRRHHRWSDSQYRDWYQRHRHNRGFDPLAAGIFGFAAGAIMAGAAASARANASSDHVAACENAYRSYDVRTDTYLGYDGVRHQCRL